MSSKKIQASKKTQASKTAPAAPAATPTPIKLPEAPAPVFAAGKTATRKKGVIKVPAVPEAVIADALASFDASQIEQVALGEGEQDVERQPPHRLGGVELLGD